MNRDLVDQPPDQLFIIFLDDRRLLPEEDAHFGVPFAQVVPTGVFNLGLLFFIAQSVNLISDLLDVGMSAGQLQKLDLHVLDLFLDFFDGCIIFLLRTVAILFCKVVRKVSLLFNRPIDRCLLWAPHQRPVSEILETRLIANCWFPFLPEHIKNTD
jgi:hypothetical protein